jgi:3'-phosphoadenosine 5'-phosphosulfate sulfotransferase (PAPS reductase)/FAD synthetase
MSDRISQALKALDDAVQEHYPSLVFAMFSGGDDSLTSTKLASQHASFSGVIHLDTGTGVRETRDFVEDTCRREGWPLKIYSAPPGEYERLVLDGYRNRKGALHQGFPHGPTSHSTMYYYLKQRQIQQAIREHKTHRRDRIGFVAGIRIAESDRRKSAKLARPHYKDPEHSAVWAHPILDWTKADCLDYLTETKTPRNPVSVNCHRSGECLCGALANHAELGEIAFFYPEVGERFARLQPDVRARGITDDEWAGGPTRTRRASARSATLPLCTSCQLPLF